MVFVQFIWICRLQNGGTYVSTLLFKTYPALPPLCLIYASVNRVSIDSDNGLSPIRRQAIIWTNTGLSSIAPSGTIFSEILAKNKLLIHELASEIIVREMAAIFSRGRWINASSSMSTQRHPTLFILASADDRTINIPGPNN